MANYVPDSRTVLLDVDRDNIQALVREGIEPPAFQMAGPRAKVYFKGGAVRAAIVTCGGLSPGINNVIRTLVFELHYRYGVRYTVGIRYGYQGFIPKLGRTTIPLKTRISSKHPREGRKHSRLLPGDGRARVRSSTSCRKMAFHFFSRSAETGPVSWRFGDPQRSEKPHSSCFCTSESPRTVDDDIPLHGEDFRLGDRVLSGIGKHSLPRHRSHRRSQAE